MTRTIYVAGYRKSGTTWLTRLLGDALNCPTGASVPESDHGEIAREGVNRKGPYIVRRGHFVLIDDEGGPVVPLPMRMAWRNLTDEGVVFMVRDPRDVAVSDSFYFNRPLDKSIELMLSQEQPDKSWSSFTEKWLNVPESFDYALVHYESLLHHTTVALGCILEDLSIQVAEDRVFSAITRQSFANRKKWTEQHGDELLFGKEYHLRFLRKGVAGDWKNHFSQAQNDRMKDAFGPTMKKLGYIR